ncbi:MAG: PD40 domain-containing protein [Bryobacterales bacterium]|nr:PD40 domain-containing protein [Bryobacterales bacterium]
MSHARGVAPWSRRAFLAAVPIPLLAAEFDRRRVFPPEWGRYADPATEFEVARLTDPQYSSLLPASYNRVIGRRNGFLLHTSDRAGGQQVFRLDLKTGESRQLTGASALDPASVTLAGGDRTFCYFDGRVLRQVQLSNLRERDVCEVSKDWERTPGFSVSSDGQRGFFGESRRGKSRLRMVLLVSGRVTTVAEQDFVLTHPLPRPRRAQVVFRQGSEAFWIVPLTGGKPRQMRTEPGELGPAIWAPSGQSLLYLHLPGPGKLNAIRESIPEENRDRLVAPTSQYAHFGQNGDASVFAGASRNAASPHVLILVRSVRREMTVCEHKSSDPASVAPIFSPDSQFIFFQSDVHGKPAIYRMNVDRLVEQTAEEDGPEP